MQGKVNFFSITAIITDNSLSCEKVWHMRENCRYLNSHSAVKVPQLMLGGVNGGGGDYARDRCVGGGTSCKNTYAILCKLFRMVEFISTSLSLLFLASLQ